MIEVQRWSLRTGSRTVDMKHEWDRIVTPAMTIVTCQPCCAITNVEFWGSLYNRDDARFGNSQGNCLRSEVSLSMVETGFIIGRPCGDVQSGHLHARGVQRVGGIREMGNGSHVAISFMRDVRR